VAQKPHAPLAPSPELRTYVIHDRNSALFHLPRDTPVERRRIDHNREIGLAPVYFGNQFVEQSPDFRQMTQNFSDADDGKVFGIDCGLTPGGAHLVAAHAEEFERWIGSAQ